MNDFTLFFIFFLFLHKRRFRNLSHIYRIAYLALVLRILLNMFAETGIRQFELAFNTYYRTLCLYTLRITGSYEEAEDIVQQTFTDIWERFSNENLHISFLKPYLFKAVHNRAINHLRLRYETETLDENFHDLPEDDTERIAEAEKENRLWKWIDDLPQERRKIFLMAKQDGLKYTEIAERLHISVKTVENQMGKALKTLREKAVKIYLFFFG